MSRAGVYILVENVPRLSDTITQQMRKRLERKAERDSDCLRLAAPCELG